MVKVEIVIDFKIKNQLQFNILTREDAMEQEVELAGLIEDANMSILRQVAKEVGVEIKENTIQPTNNGVSCTETTSDERKKLDELLVKRGKELFDSGEADAPQQIASVRFLLKSLRKINAV